MSEVLWRKRLMYAGMGLESNQVTMDTRSDLGALTLSTSIMPAATRERIERYFSVTEVLSPPVYMTLPLT
jgi:hypothetical protein